MQVMAGRCSVAQQMCGAEAVLVTGLIYVLQRCLRILLVKVGTHLTNVAVAAITRSEKQSQNSDYQYIVLLY